MVQVNGIYQGEKHCEITHGPSQSMIETDAPKDNHGRGEKFSPTDLVGTALGSCIITTMAILTEKDGIELKGSRFQVQKIMGANPRRISELKILLELPSKIAKEMRPRLEEIAHSCPVQKSLHPDLVVSLEFSYSI